MVLPLIRSDRLRADLSVTGDSCKAEFSAYTVLALTIAVCSAAITLVLSTLHTVYLGLPDATPHNPVFYFQELLLHAGFVNNTSLLPAEVLLGLTLATVLAPLGAAAPLIKATERTIRIHCLAGCRPGRAGAAQLVFIMSGTAAISCIASSLTVLLLPLIASTELLTPYGTSASFTPIILGASVSLMGVPLVSSLRDVS